MTSISDNWMWLTRRKLPGGRENRSFITTDEFGRKVAYIDTWFRIRAIQFVRAELGLSLHWAKKVADNLPIVGDFWVLDLWEVG